MRQNLAIAGQRFIEAIHFLQNIAATIDDRREARPQRQHAVKAFQRFGMAAQALQRIAAIGHGRGVAGPEAQGSLEIGQRLVMAAQHLQRHASAMQGGEIGSEGQRLFEGCQGAAGTALVQQPFAGIDALSGRACHGVQERIVALRHETLALIAYMAGGFT